MNLRCQCVCSSGLGYEESETALSDAISMLHASLSRRKGVTAKYH